MKKKVLLIIVSVLFVSGAACMFCYKGYKNYLLNYYFNLQEKNPAAEEYLQHEKMEDMNMRVIENMTFRYVRPTVGIKRIYEAEAPCDIRYYADEDMKKLKRVIKKGTRLTITLYEASENDLGRGIFSLPTHKKDVRYVRPFAESDNDNEADNWYYVRLSDIERIIEETVKYNEELRNKSFYFGYYGVEKRLFPRLHSRYMDLIFYRKGIYLSNDVKYDDIKYIIQTMPAS